MNEKAVREGLARKEAERKRQSLRKEAIRNKVCPDCGADLCVSPKRQRWPRNVEENRCHSCGYFRDVRWSSAGEFGWCIFPGQEV